MEYNIEKIIKLATKFNELTPREQKILVMRFANKLTLEEVGQEFGVTRERIRQIEAKIIEKFKEL